MRLFAAIKVSLSSESTTVFFSLQNELRNEKINWVKNENFHLTMKFFGETTEAGADRIIKGFDTIKCNKFIKVNIQKLGVFGSKYNPKVIWLGIENPTQILGLHHQIVEAISKIGYKETRQNFVPHITLARIKQIEDKKYFQEVMEKYRNSFIQPIACIEEFYLYESILHRNGPQYRIVERFQLV